MDQIFKCKNVLVLGAGSWGTAIALHLARLDYNVSLWGRSAEKLLDMQKARRNKEYLPNAQFPDNLNIVLDLEYALDKAEIVFCMVPSNAFTEILTKISPFYKRNVPFIWGTKGMLGGQDDFGFLDVAVTSILGEKIPYAAMSGPTFATEIAAELPAAVVVAAKEKSMAVKLQLLLHSDNFRVYSSDDIKGVQVCGAIKNILAVASGVADGLGLGANTRSALITRGLVEMSRVAIKAGCKQDTLMGLAGMGDLILTSTSDLSRNRRLGLAIGKGVSLEQATSQIGQVVESLHNAKLLLGYGRAHGIEIPITEQVCNILSGQVTPKIAVSNLLSRAPRSEFTIG